METKPVQQLTSEDHRRGSLYAPITMIEYGDYECGYCALFAPTLERVIREFEREICFVFRHFPLHSLHPHAEQAALAALAANEQGRFWAMHELLFENSDTLSMDTFIDIAEIISLNIPQFREDMQRQDLLERVRDSVLQGARSGIQSTPTLFINNRKYERPHTYRALQDTIDRLLNQPQPPAW